MHYERKKRKKHARKRNVHIVRKGIDIFLKYSFGVKRLKYRSIVYFQFDKRKFMDAYEITS